MNHIKDYIAIAARKLIADRTPMDLDKLRKIDVHTEGEAV